MEHYTKAHRVIIVKTEKKRKLIDIEYFFNSSVPIECHTLLLIKEAT